MAGADHLADPSVGLDHHSHAALEALPRPGQIGLDDLPLTHVAHRRGRCRPPHPSPLPEGEGAEAFPVSFELLPSCLRAFFFFPLMP